MSKRRAERQAEEWIERQPFWVRMDTTRAQLAALAFLAGRAAGLRFAKRARHKENPDAVHRGAK